MLSGSTKKTSALIVLWFSLLLPFNLYAEWSTLPAFLADFFNAKPAAIPSAAAIVEPQSKNSTELTPMEKEQAPASPDQLPAAAAAVSGESAVPSPVEVIPVRIEATATRELAPFAPSLALSSQLLAVDSEWSGAVAVDGGITVASAATLTINPGTVVRFTKGSGLHVLGRIVIKGTKEDPVRLTSLYREPQESDWSGIFLSGTSKKNVFENVVIQGAETAFFARFSSFYASFVEINNSASGLKLQSSNATIANTVIAVPVTAIMAAKSEIFMEKCSISGGQSGVIVNSSAIEAREISIKSCRLTAFTANSSQLKLDRLSLSACQSALLLNKCDGTVSNSLFTNNQETGVVLTGSNLRFTGNTLAGNRVGIQIDDSLPSLWANNISGNSDYNLVYLGDESLFVGGNIFGGQAGVESDNKVFSKRLGAVQMAPFFSIEP